MLLRYSIVRYALVNLHPCCCRGGGLRSLVASTPPLPASLRSQTPAGYFYKNSPVYPRAVVVTNRSDTT